MFVNVFVLFSFFRSIIFLEIKMTRNISLLFFFFLKRGDVYDGDPFRCAVGFSSTPSFCVRLDIMMERNVLVALSRRMWLCSVELIRMLRHTSNISKRFMSQPHIHQILGFLYTILSIIRRSYFSIFYSNWKKKKQKIQFLNSFRWKFWSNFRNVRHTRLGLWKNWLKMRENMGVFFERGENMFSSIFIGHFYPNTLHNNRGHFCL